MSDADGTRWRHEWRNSPGGRYIAFRTYNAAGFPQWKAEIDKMMKHYVTCKQHSPWEPWPEGIETIADMKAYIETLDRMGEL